MRRRITICLGMLLALCLTGNAIALLSLDRSIKGVEELAESYRIQSMRSALDSSAIRVERDLLAHLIRPEGGDGPFRDSIWRFRDSLRQCGSCHHTPINQAQLDRVELAFEDWLVEVEALAAAVESGAIGSGEESLIAIASHVPEMTSAMIDQAHTRLKAKGSDVGSIVHRAWVTLWATLAVALVVGGVIALHLQRSVTKPLSDLLVMIRRSRQDESLDQATIEGDKEFRELGEAFQHAYRDLKSAQAGILQAEKLAAVGRLAAGVAHEVANPLASISSIVQLMRRSSRSAEDTERLDLIMNHIGRISGIVRETLSFSRPRSEMRLVPVQVASLLDQSLQLVAYDKRAGGIRMIRDYAQDLPPVLADADGIIVVFTNIVLNAIDALSAEQEGEPALEISARTEGGQVVVRFSDNGHGMTQQEIASAFEPFFTTKQPGAGTGLGLWVCYETMRKHDGNIRIESQETGTTVTIKMPCADASAGGE